jgi:hypothetical protein
VFGLGDLHVVDLYLAFYPLFLLNCFLEYLGQAENGLALGFVGVKVEIFELAVQFLHVSIGILEFDGAERFDSVESLPQDGLFSVDSFLQLMFLRCGFFNFLNFVLAALLRSFLLLFLGGSLSSFLGLIVQHFFLPVQNSQCLSNRLLESRAGSILKAVQRIDGLVVQFCRERFVGFAVDHEPFGVIVHQQFFSDCKSAEFRLHEHMQRGGDDLELRLQPT